MKKGGEKRIAIGRLFSPRLALPPTGPDMEISSAWPKLCPRPSLKKAKTQKRGEGRPSSRRGIFCLWAGKTSLGQVLLVVTDNTLL